MMRSKQMSSWAGVGLALLIATGAHAVPPPAGVIDFTPVRLSTPEGAKLDNAILSYQGKAYEVRMNGVGVGGVVGVDVTVSGEVYGLNDLADIEGVFVTEPVDGEVAEGSGSDLWLYSERGVSLRLQTDNESVGIAPGGDAVSVLFGRSE